MPRWRRCAASRSRSPRSTPRQGEGRGQAQGGQEGRRQGPGQEPGDLHPPVLGHDRRRPAAGAVSGHPRQAGAAQGLLGRHPQDPRGRRVGRGAGRRDEEASEDLRHALLEHDRGGRGRRYSRHHPQAARDLHREVGQAEGRSEVRDDLPDRGHRDRGGGGRRDPVEGHPDVRPAVLRPRRPAAAADPRRHRREQQPGVLRVDSDRRARRGGYGAQDLLRHRATAAT